MSLCPACGAAYRSALLECPACHLPLAAASTDEASPPRAQNWITVYLGCGFQLRLVEESLRSQGFPVARLYSAENPIHLTPAHRNEDATYYKLTVPEDQYLARQEEVQALVAAGCTSEENTDAIREAEEDYDVRGCPQCLLYFHRNYSRCPGCEADLVPAVECFEGGQAEPDRVVVGHGMEAVVKTLESRLRGKGFDAQSFEIEGWPLDVVDLPWREITDRTAEIEAVLGIASPSR